MQDVVAVDVERGIPYLFVVFRKLFDPLEEFWEELWMDNSLYDL